MVTLLDPTAWSLRSIAKAPRVFELVGTFLPIKPFFLYISQCFDRFAERGIIVASQSRRALDAQPISS